MARSYMLKKINGQVNRSFKKLRKDFIGQDGKPIPETKKNWNRGRINGLKTAKRAFYSGRKEGITYGRKSGYRSGLRVGRMQGRMFSRSYR